MLFNWYKGSGSPKSQTFYATYNDTVVLVVGCSSRKSGGRKVWSVKAYNNHTGMGFETSQRMNPKAFCQRIENGLVMLDDDIRKNIFDDIFHNEFRLVNPDDIKPIYNNLQPI